jgi:hypothetical protein
VEKQLWRVASGPERGKPLGYLTEEQALIVAFEDGIKVEPVDPDGFWLGLKIVLGVLLICGVGGLAIMGLALFLALYFIQG